MSARDTCPKCESVRPGSKGKRMGKKWRQFEPEHGSIIVLEAAANETVEHAVLQEKGPKELRISINTKNIPPDHMTAVEGAGVTRLVPGQAGSLIDGLFAAVEQDLIPSGALRKVSPQLNGPRVWSIKRQHPKDAIYVGCRGTWKCCKCHEQDVRVLGSMYGNSYKPRMIGGHAKFPIGKAENGKTAVENYCEKLDAKWNSTAPNDVKWKERAIKELRGKNLLCWCLQPEDVDGVKVTKPEGCHARVLFEYVNRP
jgi:hypothetical protein